MGVPCCAGTRRVRRRSSLISTPRCDVDRYRAGWLCNACAPMLQAPSARQINRADGWLRQCSAAFTHIIYYGLLIVATVLCCIHTGAVARPRVPRHDEGAGAAQPSAGTPRVLTGYSLSRVLTGYSLSRVLTGYGAGAAQTRAQIKQINQQTNNAARPTWERGLSVNGA